MAAPLAPIDESVQVPESVKRAAAAAEAAHKEAYQTPDPPPEPPAEPPAETPPAEAVTAPVTPEPEPTPPAPEPPPTPPAPVTPEQWEHRYHSMRGRYEQASTTIGTMQEQMQQLGDELMRTQSMLQQRTPQAPPPPKKLITDEDVKVYGPELLDVVTRAAEEAMTPKFTAIEQENRQLRQQVQQQSQRSVHDMLNAEVPNWREINKNPRFVQWLRLPDIYSGEIRQSMLNRAFQAAQAPRVAAFFKGFINDEVATGQMAPPTDPPAAQAPRVAAVSLESLAAPGRARPATGDSQVPLDKPIYSRNQIADFYTLVRQGKYNGRDQDKQRDEAAIFAAQREGRVR